MINVILMGWIILILLEYGEMIFKKNGILFQNKVLMKHLEECGIFIYLTVKLGLKLGI